MGHVSARLHFENGFKGQLELKEGSLAIGTLDNEARPYDLLQGALAACLHSTLLDILTKKKIELEFADYKIEGNKREEVPTMLDQVVIHVTFPKGTHEEQLKKSMVLASKYCSVYNTLSKVADMHIEVHFR